MKLNEGYEASDNKKTNNSLFEYFQAHFYNALRGPEDRDPAKETIAADSYHYELSPADIEFYENLYVNSTVYRVLEEDTWLREIFSFRSTNNLEIDENVKDILDFIKIPDPLLVLMAPVGWGKTVLLKYIWEYLIFKSKWLYEHVYPIYLQVDNYRNVFEELTSKRQIREDIYKYLIHERLIEIVKNFVDLDDENFWSYIKESTDSFNDLEQRERDIAKLFSGNGTNREKQKMIYTVRMEAREKEEFYLYATKYIVEKKNKVVLLIFDNVDPLPINIHDVILDEAMLITKKFGFKIIISMRTNTYFELAANPNGRIKAYIPRTIKMNQRNVGEYLKRRTNAIIATVDGFGKENGSFTAGGKRIKFQDLRKVIESMISILLSSESADILNYVSNHNLRKLNFLLITYLQTGYIDENRLITNIIQDQVTEEPSTESPLWVLLSSIITANHLTRFPLKYTGNYEGDILNIYCNGEIIVDRYFIRIYLLNYLKLNGHSSFNEIFNAYNGLHKTARPDTKKAIEYAIKRFIDCELVVSPEYYKVIGENRVSEINNLSLNDTGEYYIKHLRNYFEYLIYMKDDVDLVTNVYNILDCIEVRHFSDRYRELQNYLRMVIEMEENFLMNEISIEKRGHFISDFCIEGNKNVSIFSSPVESMISFGIERNVPEEFINEYKELLKQTINLTERFIDKKLS